jgi:hypothetical protein
MQEEICDTPFPRAYSMRLAKAYARKPAWYMRERGGAAYKFSTAEVFIIRAV